MEIAGVFQGETSFESLSPSNFPPSFLNSFNHKRPYTKQKDSGSLLVQKGETYEKDCVGCGVVVCV